MFGNVATNNKRWEKTKLGNKSVIGSSKRIFANEYTTEGIPFYRSKEIIELGMGEKPSVELYISKKRYQEIKEKFGIPIPGDILMTAVGTIGKFWIVPNSKPFYYKDGNLVYIRTKEFNPLFLKKLLEMLIEKYKVENANGSAYTALTIEKLKDLQIVLPPMTLQKQYEEFHIQIDKSKFLLQQILEKFELLKKSRFIELIGNIQNPKYQLVELNEICEFIKDGTHQTPIYTEDRVNGFKFLSSKDVTSQKINWSNIKYIPKELHEQLYAKLSPKRGDILLAKNGTTGVAAVVDSDEIFDIYVSLALLRPKSGVNVSYLCSALNSEDLKRQFNSSLKGIGVPNLHLREIKKARIIFPPIDIQNKISSITKQIDKSKFNVFQDQTAAQVKVIVYIIFVSSKGSLLMFLTLKRSIAIERIFLTDIFSLRSSVS